MRFFHLSDLHIGKQLHHYSLLEDQRHILKEVAEYAKDLRPDAIVISGDIYDKALPGAEAVSLFDDFLTELASLKGPLVLLVSGNHDSPQRLAYASRILGRENIHIAAELPKSEEERLKKVTLKDEFGEVDFYLLPFLKPGYVRHLFKENPPDTYSQAVARLLEREMPDTYSQTAAPMPESENPDTYSQTAAPMPESENPDTYSQTAAPMPESENPDTYGQTAAPMPESENPDTYSRTAAPMPESENPDTYSQTAAPMPESENPDTYSRTAAPMPDNENPGSSRRRVLLSHQFYAGNQGLPETCDSELLSVGGIDRVDIEPLLSFDYVALGHLHKAQQVGRPYIRYCGTLLKYSVSEALHAKSLHLVELREKGTEVSVEQLDLHPLRDVRALRGELAWILEHAREENREDYVSITLTDETDPYRPKEQLEKAYNHILDIRMDNARTRKLLEESGQAVEIGDPMTVFGEFYKELQGRELLEQEKEFMLSVFERAKGD